MSIKLEAGKYYKDRKGEVYGPIARCQSGDSGFCFCASGKDWTSEGLHCRTGECDSDLIYEVFVYDKPVDAGADVPVAVNGAIENEGLFVRCCITSLGDVIINVDGKLYDTGKRIVRKGWELV